MSPSPLDGPLPMSDVPRIETYDVSPTSTSPALPQGSKPPMSNPSQPSTTHHFYPLCGSSFLRHLRSHSDANYTSLPFNQSPNETPLDGATPFLQHGSPCDTASVSQAPTPSTAATPTSAYSIPPRDRSASLPPPEGDGPLLRVPTPRLTRPPTFNEQVKDRSEDYVSPLPRSAVGPFKRRPRHHRQSASASTAMLLETMNMRSDSRKTEGERRPSPVRSRQLKNLNSQQATSWNEFAYAYSQGAFDPLRAPLPPLGEAAVLSASPEDVTPPGRRGSWFSSGVHDPFPRPSSAPPSPNTARCDLPDEPHTTGLESFVASTPSSPPHLQSYEAPDREQPKPTEGWEQQQFETICNIHDVGSFYAKNGFLPAPLPPNEPERLKALYSFNILYTSDDVNFDRIVNMIKMVFNTRMAFLSLLDSDKNWYKSYAGNGYNCSCMARSLGFCSHVVLRDSDESFVILDTKKDWRFKNNPFVTNSPHLRFYAAAPLRTSDGHNVGTLALVDDQPRSDFPARSRHILKEFAAIVMRELELWRDRLQLRMRDRIQQAIEKFARECLESSDDDMPGLTSNDSHLSQVYQRAAELIKTTLGLDGCSILDVSQFERVEMPCPDGKSTVAYQASPYTRNGLGSQTDGFPEFVPAATFPVLATTAPDGIKTQQLRSWEHDMVSEFLHEHRDGRIFDSTPPWLHSVYPSSLKYAMAVPIFGIDQHPFALICAHTHDKGKQFLKGFELQFLRSIGSIILSSVLRRRTVLADRSKNVLISSVSHELRTPLHGMLAAGELLSDTPLNDSQEAFLSTLRTCGLQLIETVNHVLDFAKLSVEGKDHSRSQIKFQRVNLAELIHSTMEGCWLGQRARLLQMDENDLGSFYSPEAKGFLPSEERKNILPQLSQVESVLDIGFREKGWNVICETGGLRRAIMNLYNNSLKFTKEGYVQIILRELRHPPGQRRIPVELRVVDTGKGIGKDFIKNQMFQPFAQENPLQPGTGLGLAIVGNIVTSESLGGALNVYSAENVGTEIRIQFEVEIIDDEDDGEPRPWRDPALGLGYRLAFINYSQFHRGLQLHKEVLTRYASCLGFKIVDDVADADIVVVNEITGVTPAVAEQCRGLAMLIVMSCKMPDKDTLEALGRTESYTGLLFKPMGPQHLARSLTAALSWIKDPTNPDLLGAVSQLNEAAELRKRNDSLSTADPDVNKMMEEVLGHRPNVSLAEKNIPSCAPSPGLKDSRVRPAPLLIPRDSSAPFTASMLASPASAISRQPSLLPPRPSPARTQSAPSTSNTPDSSSDASTPTTPTTPLTTLPKLPATPVDRAPSKPSPASPGSTGFSTVSIDDVGGVMLASCHAQSACAGPGRTRSPRIMVVEDNPINRRVLSAMLKKRNIEFTEAVDGCAGLELFKNSPPNH